MKKCIFNLLICLSFLGQTYIFAQKPHNEGLSIEGHVFNQETEEAVMYASVMLKNTTIGTTTDEEGSFIIRNLKAGSYVLQISCLGFETKELNVEITNAKTPHIHVELKPYAVTIEQVVVSANRNETKRTEAPVIVNFWS